MRKWIYMFMAAGLLLSACVKENRSGSAEGTPVLFSASTVETRTTYSGQVTDGYERIDWSANDQIKINCLQTTPTSATYKIGSGSASGKQSEATGITCTSGNQLQWGSGTHRFFAVYPSSADLTVSGTGNSTKGTMSGTIPATQDGSPALSSYGYMYASATESNPGMYQSVNLAFRPLFNAVEFSLKAGDPETAAQLTSIVLSSGSENLAGSFSAEWTAGSTAPTVNPGSSGLSQSVTISTNVSLSQSTASKFTFITMPITQDNLTLTLNYASYYSRTLTLKNGSGTAVSLSPGERVVFGEISVPKKIVHVTGVTLNKTALSLVNGTNETLIATVAPNDAADKSVNWSSSNESVATVNSSGKVTAKAVGTTTITVTTVDGGKTATCTVTVTPILVSSISLSNASVNVGSTVTLTPTISPSNAANKNVTWSSSDTGKATVNSSGVVTGVSAGTVTITATAQDGSGVSGSCTVTVNNVPVTSVTLNKSSLSLVNGTNETLVATVNPSNATNKSVNWSSSNTSVATVNSSGKVTAKAVGTTTITVTTVDGGKTATCTVTVNATQYTITFKSGNTVYIKTNSTQPSAVIDQGQSYISSFSNTWSGLEALDAECWFVNSSGYLNPPSNLGTDPLNPTVTLTMALSSAGQKNVKRIVMNVKWDETHWYAKEIKVNGVAPNESISASSSTGTVLSFTMNPSTTMTSIAIFMNCTKFQIQDITVEYEN